jgi:ABC-type amino acid transport substrate-binding protein
VIWRLGTVGLLLALAFAPRPAAAEAAGLRLLFVGDAAPFSSAGAGGTPEGYVVALCERIAGAIQPGARPSWRETAIADGLDLLAHDQADLLCGPVSDTVARQQHVDFTSPIAIGGIGAVLRPGAPPWLLHLLSIGEGGPASPRALIAKLDWPRRIAVLRDGTAADWLAGVLASAQVNVVTVPVADYDEAVRRLADGDVGAWVGEWGVLLQRVRLEPRLAGMTLVPRPIVGEPLAVAMRPDPGLRRAVQAVLSAILRSSDFDTLATHWFGAAGRAQVPLIQSVTPRVESPP